MNSYACGIDTLGDSAEPFGPSTARLSNSCNTNISSPGGSEITPGSPSQPFLQHHPIHGQNLGNAGMPLRVMKFGGTSVGDASCIGKVVEIIRAASRESKVVVVVSAMSGVTNSLIEAATHSKAGHRGSVATIFEELRTRHEAAIVALIHSPAERKRIGHKLQEIFQEGERICQDTILVCELMPRAQDLISSLGERLSAPLVAAALAESGVASAAIDATELIVTDSNHGAADPWIDLTRERCDTHLRPLLRQGIVPVVTGFIGATTEGVLTTLGRGGSDYSATIVAAALNADEVTIWKEVDGLMTADPSLVPDACTVSEISYREAADLAYFGAKVLHPKTLCPVMQCGIPLWIRNTFAPERRGTKITQRGSANGGGVKALTALSDAGLIIIGGPGIVGLPDILRRALEATAGIRADVLLISQSSSPNDISLVVSSSHAEPTVEALRREFSQELESEKLEHIKLDPTISIVTVVGQNMRGMSGIVGRTFGALGRQNVDIMAIAQGSSECKISFVVAKKDMTAALVTAHREFQLGMLDPQALPSTPSNGAANTLYESGPEFA